MYTCTGLGGVLGQWDQCWGRAPSIQKSSVKIWTMGKKHALLGNSGAWKTVELVSLVFSSLPLLRQAEVSQRSFAAGNLHQSPDPCPGCLLVTVRTSGYVSLEFSSSVRVFCNPMNYSPPGSSVYVTFQARILEWVAISSSRGSSWAWDRTHIPCISRRILYHWASPETSRYIDPLLILMTSQARKWQINLAVI